MVTCVEGRVLVPRPFLGEGWTQFKGKGMCPRVTLERSSPLWALETAELRLPHNVQLKLCGQGPSLPTVPGGTQGHYNEGDFGLFLGLTFL